ncbi:hypothetical protein niasHS_009961 [Heterodera schachtii]|uniref:Homeobox domain-containing protein n=1 Tax=Heterodera schachtii TaxID=97005 RepID=A0ABD2JD53_HETSC
MDKLNNFTKTFVVMGYRKTKNSNLTSGGERKRQTRRTFTQEQIGQMEMVFSCSHYPDMLSGTNWYLKLGSTKTEFLFGSKTDAQNGEEK